MLFHNTCLNNAYYHVVHSDLGPAKECLQGLECDYSDFAEANLGVLQYICDDVDGKFLETRMACKEEYIQIFEIFVLVTVILNRG